MRVARGAALLAACLVAAAARAEPPAERRFNDRDGSELVRVPAGTFSMGSADVVPAAVPVHAVELDAFWIGVREVTWRQYRRFCDDTATPMPSRPEWAGDDHPVIGVLWQDAAAYCDWAGLRLPSEAEWELAARGFEGRSYPWGEEAPAALGQSRPPFTPSPERLEGERRRPGGWARANFGGSDRASDGFEQTAPVGSFPSGASPFGCLDMAGNAAEWCRDWFSPDAYAASPRRNPAGPSTGSTRVLRGGSWLSSPAQLRSAMRNFARSFPALEPPYAGFRVAR